MDTVKDKIKATSEQVKSQVKAGAEKVKAQATVKAKELGDKLKEAAKTPGKSYRTALDVIFVTLHPVVTALYYLQGLFMILMMLAALSGNIAVAVASGFLFLGGLIQTRSFMLEHAISQSRDARTDPELGKLGTQE